MTVIVEMLVWSLMAAIGMTYFGYPVLLLALQPFRKGTSWESITPRVTFMISAYNEAAVIRQKIENTLSLEYPAQQLEIIVISDASDDGTDQIVAEYADRRVALCRLEPRQGKSAGLSRFVPTARGEIIVFSDANPMYDRDALRKLVRHFADHNVGFVVGYQGYEDEQSAASQSESLYWRYETWLKVLESGAGSVVCGDGAIQAMRAELFETLRSDVEGDDYLPLRAVAQSYRCVFEREAICLERSAEDLSGEFRRKKRNVNRGLLSVWLVSEVMNPFRVGWFAVQVLLHKVLRWFVPFFLLVILVGSAYLSWQGRPVYQGLLALQAVCYGLAGLYVVPWLRRFRVVYVPFYFCLVNAAAAVGVLSFLAGRRIATWQPERTPAEAMTGR